MRVSIKGVPAISKEVWSTKAHMHRGFSESLSVLLTADESGPLADALRKMIEKNNRLAEACNELEKDTKKGRPTKKPVNVLASLFPAVKKRPGRPSELGPEFDQLTYRVVEQRRDELAAQKKSKPTTTAAINSINAQFARDNSKRESTYVRKEFARVHSAYQRGKKLFGT